MDNEIALCALDFLYWATNYAWIRNRGGSLVLFWPQIGQQIFLDICGEMEEAGVAIMIQALKARQLGISTIAELIVAHRVQFYEETNAVIASSDPGKSREMSKMIERCYLNMPWWLMPCTNFSDKASKDLKYKAGELIEFPSLNSGLSIQWGNQTTGIARGTTPTVVHLSETAEFEHPEELVDAALMPAFHDDPFNFMVLESTANGFNWWYRKWMQSKKWPSHSRLRPMFLPWYVGRELYPSPTWLRGHPIPTGWIPQQKTLDHATRAAQHVTDRPLLRKYLGHPWQMDPSQQWFYEANKEEFIAMGELNKWFQEMPADDLECFQHRNVSIFDAQLLSDLRDSAPPPLLVCGLTGRPEDLPLRLQPSTSDYDTTGPYRPRAVVCAWAQDQPPTTFTLQPIKWQGTSEGDPLGKVFIYQLPEAGQEYAIGIDTGFGVRQDRTVVQVIKKATPFEDARQVAEFASDEVGAANIWPWALTLGTLYSTTLDGERHQAKMVIECGGMSANGDMALQDLIRHGWTYHHLRTKQSTFGLIPSNRTTPQWGWHTTEATRGPMIEFLVKALRDGWLKIASPHLIYEMGELIRNEKKERLEAADGGHDDRLMALGIAFYSLHQGELYRSATPVWQRRIAAAATDHLLPVYNPSGVGWQSEDGEGWRHPIFNPDEFAADPDDPLLEYS